MPFRRINRTRYGWGAAAAKRERKIDELFGYRQLELAAPETRTAPGRGRLPPRPSPAAGGRGGRSPPQRAVAKRVRLLRSYLHHHHPRPRRRRHPVLVAQEKDRRDHRRGEEKKRNGFTDLLQFDSDGRASELPHLSAFADGGLTGVEGLLGGKVATNETQILCHYRSVWDGVRNIKPPFHAP